MKTKSNKTLWIVLGIIVAVIAILSFTTCINTRTTLSTSDFDAAVFMLEDGKITKQEITDSDSQNLKDLFGKYYIKDDTEITISVADTGVVIPKESYESVFEPFQCSDDSRQKKDGSGLGLAISKRIVELHNGKLYIDDSIKGYTKAFVINLPQGKQQT